MSTVSKPPLTDYNKWAKFWFYIIGANVIPMVTRFKTGKKDFTWKEWKNIPIPEETFEKWIKEDAFRGGFGVILGKLWRGENAGRYLILIDLDNQLALDEFCTSKDGKEISLKEVAEQYIVEQHKDNTSKAHIILYSDVPFVGKINDASYIKDYKQKLRDNTIPGFEIKGNGADGVFFATPSIHQDGEHYDIIGTLIPPKILSENAAKEMMQHIDNICKKYGLHYLENATVVDPTTGETRSSIPREHLFNPDYLTTEGNNRHQRHLSMFDSLIYNLYKKEGQPLDKVKLVAKTFATIVCQPPKSEELFEKDWADAIDFILKEDERKKHEDLLEGCEMMEQISRSPETYIAVVKKNDYHNPTTGAMQKVRAIQEIVIDRVKDKKTGVVEIEHKYKNIILNAAPVPPIEIIKDPLFGSVKYRMYFEYVEPSDQGPGFQIACTPEPIGPFSKEQLRDYLVENTPWVYKNRLLDDALNQVLKGYATRKGLSKTIEEIEPEGFFYLNGRIVSSKLDLRPPTPHNVAEGIITLLTLQKRFHESKRDRTRLSYYTKLHFISPFDYVRKQMNLVHRYGWIRRGDLSGKGGATKSEQGRLACYYWRLDTNTHIMPKRNIDSDARLIDTLESTTMPLTFEEPDFLTPKEIKKTSSQDKLSTLKNTVDTLSGFRSTYNHKRIPERYLAYFMLTHNSPPILEEGSNRRLQPDIYEEKDKKDYKGNEATLDAYREFIADNRDKLAYLSDYDAHYIMNNLNVLKYNWLGTVQQILKQMFEYADFSQVVLPKEFKDDADIKSVIESKKCPDWLMKDVIEDASTGGSGVSDEDIKSQKRGLVKAAFLKMIMKSWKDYEYPLNQSGEFVGTPELITIVQWLVKKNKLPGFVHHPSFELCATTAAIHTLKDYGLDPDEHISHADLEHLCGFKPGYGKERIDGKAKNFRIQHMKYKDFVSLIAPSDIGASNEFTTDTKDDN